MKRIKVLAVCFVAACLPLVPNAAGAVQYQIHVLDAPSGNAYSYAYKINEQGVIAGGAATTYSARNNAGIYLWNAGGTPNYAGFSSSGTVGLNNVGTIVGSHFVSSNGSVSTLPYMNATYRSNTLMDVNDQGIVVGGSLYNYVDQMPYNIFHAALWDSNGVHDLGTLQGSVSSYATAINMNGEVTGYCEDSLGQNVEGFTWQNGKMTGIGPVYPADINVSGAVIGNNYNGENYYSGAYETAYIYQDDQLTSLLGWTDKSTAATGINDSGQIALYSYTYYGQQTAYVWNDGSLVSLPDLGHGALTGGINDSGWVVGMALGSDNNWHAVEWIPVPEPSSLIAVLCGLSCGGVAFLRRFRA